METMTIDKKIFTDLVMQVNELNDQMESLEIMSNPEIMKSLKKSEEQIKNRDFADWNEL
jgi:hypothetical protein